jgi:hypothetical protein
MMITNNTKNKIAKRMQILSSCMKQMPYRELNGFSASQKFLAFYRIQRFITAFSRDNILLLS